MHARALRNRHFSLRYGAIAGDLDECSAQQMQNADAAFPAFLIDAYELLECSLKPRRHHDAIFVPYSAETFPIAGIAPDGPVFDDFLDCEDVECSLVHGSPPGTVTGDS